MPELIFVTHDGTQHRIAAETGESVMKTALAHDVPGIVAECGGCAACATCRIFVDEVWVDRLTPPDALESSVLEAEEETRPGLRLACQLEVCERLDGLVVHIPASQY